MSAIAIKPNTGVKTLEKLFSCSSPSWKLFFPYPGPKRVFSLADESVADRNPDSTVCPISLDPLI